MSASHSNARDPSSTETSSQATVQIAPPPEWMFVMGELSGNVKALTSQMSSFQRSQGAALAALTERVTSLEKADARGSGQVSVITVLVTAAVAIAVSVAAGVIMFTIKGS